MPNLAIRVYALAQFPDHFAGVLMNKTSQYIRDLSAGLFALSVALLAAAQAQNPTSVPNGLPSWAYNIPDKDQPPTPKLTGTIRVPGTTKENDASQVRTATSPPDCFPDEHPAAPQIAKAPNAPPGAVCRPRHLIPGQVHP